jgi:hypothetical protein
MDILHKRSPGMPPLAALAFAALIGAVPARAAEWVSYRNARFGYSLLYPADIFLPAPGETAPGGGDGGAHPKAGASEGAEDGRKFRSRDGRAKLVAFATFNSDFTPEEYRETILKEFKGYDRITYGPTSKTWFVLSGFRGGDIYYQKVMFSCGGKVINALSVTFPAEQKPLYAPLIERMEDNFKPGCPK